MGLPFREGVIRCAEGVQRACHVRQAPLEERESSMLSPFAPVRPYAMRRKKVRPSWHLVTWLVLVVLTAGCATFRCRPTTIVVAKKDENVRLETRPGLPRTTANDRVEE